MLLSVRHHAPEVRHHWQSSVALSPSGRHSSCLWQQRSRPVLPAGSGGSLGLHPDRRRKLSHCTLQEWHGADRAGNDEGQSNLPALMTYIRDKMPAGAHFFPEDQVTNRSERFLAAELIREKIVRQLGDEMPYTTAVEIESFKLDGKLLRIDALIYVERQGQKKIVIGEGGSRLRSIGTEARKDMEMAFSGKVMLKLWVKVKSGWSDDERALRSLGFEDSI